MHSILALRGKFTSDESIIRQIYISISFPELGKLPIMLLLTWDHAMGLVLLYGLLIISVQLLSLQVIDLFILSS
jgi:hypothetical protein